jgi:hypothetical protein
VDTKKIVALILIGLLAVVLIVNRGVVDGVGLNLVIDSVRMSKSMLILASTALGVVIGVLLK